MRKKNAVAACCMLLAVSAGVAMFLRPSSTYRQLYKFNAAYTNGDEYTGEDMGHRLLFSLGNRRLGDITSASIKDDGFLDSHAKLLTSLPRVSIVNIASTKITATGIRTICDSKQVKWVAFAVANVDKDVVKAVCTNQHRESALSVIIQCKSIGKSALSHLSRKQLETLIITSGDLDDAAISKIVGFQCRSLRFWGGNISPRAIEAFLERNAIKRLYVKSSKISKSQLAKLGERRSAVVEKPDPPVYQNYEQAMRGSYYYNPGNAVD